jgi:glycosyltransferase involved in cell wall biosynthesis
VVAAKVTFAIPGDLATPTGGYGYARCVIAALRERNWRVGVIDLGDRFPRAGPAERASACARLLAAPADVPIIVDGLALGVLAEEAHTAARDHCLIGLVHHPLALETGLAAEEAAAFRASETRALAAVRHVITTDESTGTLLAASYQVPRRRITVARPGVTRVCCAAQASHDGPVRMLAVGAVVPRKGYDLLVDALCELRELPWHLTIVGDRDRSSATAAALDRAIEGRGLADRIACVGAVSPERLDTLYRASDLFVQASWFEGYGMAVAEAIACGVPAVATQTGAALRIVGSHAGRLVAPGDATALTRALRLLIADRDLRANCAAAARRAAESLPTWEQTASAFEEVLGRIS